MTEIKVPIAIFRHAAFRHNRAFRVGAYTWLVANSPANTSLREMAREFQCTHGMICRLINSFIDHGLIVRQGGCYIVVPWQEIEAPRTSKGSFERMRAAVFARDNHQCVYCGSRDQLSCDHVTPRSRGGLNIMTNLVTACQTCNSAKGPLTAREWLGNYGD